MSRYVARRPRADFDEDAAIFERETIDVIEDDDGPVPTGLLDAAGVPIYRVRERVRCGFIADDGE